MAIYGFALMVLRPILGAISKPIARHAKAYAREHPAFRHACISFGSMFQTVENGIARIGGWKPKYQTLNENKVIEMESELVAEMLVLVVPIGWIAYDFRKKEKKEREDREIRNRMDLEFQRIGREHDELRSLLEIGEKTPESLAFITRLESEIAELKDTVTSLKRDLSESRKNVAAVQREHQKQLDSIRRELKRESVVLENMSMRSKLIGGRLNRSNSSGGDQSDAPTFTEYTLEPLTVRTLPSWFLAFRPPTELDIRRIIRSTSDPRIVYYMDRTGEASCKIHLTLEERTHAGVFTGDIVKARPGMLNAWPLIPSWRAPTSVQTPAPVVTQRE